MATPRQERSGVLVLRAWSEPDDASSFRARLLTAPEPDGEATTLLVTADQDEVLAAVKTWLDGLARS